MTEEPKPSEMPDTIFARPYNSGWLGGYWRSARRRHEVNPVTEYVRKDLVKELKS